MVPATDSAISSSARWFCLGFALVAILAQAGCSRLRSFSQPKSTEPAFGTDVVTRDETKPGAPRISGDLYARRFRTPRGSSEPAVANNTRGTDQDEPAPTSDQPEAEVLNASHEHPQVALQAPVTLPALSNANRQFRAKRTDEAPAPGADELLAPVTPARAEAVADRPQAAGPTLDSILADSRRTLDGLATYQVKMTHQERVGGTLNPAEDVLLSIRRSPKAVRLEWPSGPHKGREVVYAADAKGGLMHVNMADSVVPVPRLSMPPDSPLATRTSRHPINEAGFDTIVHNMEESLRLQTSGTAERGRISYDGMEQPEGLDKPCMKVRRITPQGEIWLVYIDPDNHLPALVQATTSGGELLERYVFRDPKFEQPELASAEAFDPDARWGPSKGFLQRFARGGSAATADATQTR